MRSKSIRISQENKIGTMVDALHKDLMITIRNEEQKASLRYVHIIEETYQLTFFLKGLLSKLKSKILKEGFRNETEEIKFFKEVKPQILGKLIYYNKLYRIETSCPVSRGNVYRQHYNRELKELKIIFEQQVCNSDFYRYYRSGRTDRDEDYFKLGNIKIHNGLNSFAFEIDPEFSTYYDYKTAQILANDLLYIYLTSKTNEAKNEHQFDELFTNKEEFKWTASKNALIELIYALYISKSLSNGKVGVRKIASLFQKLFGIELGDTHHAFHRMKNRTESRTLFLDSLKSQLEQYMEKE